MSEKQVLKNANFLSILFALRRLRDLKIISEHEYEKAKHYYQKLLGSTVALVD